MRVLPFTKMQGLGNDFVVLDARRRSIPLSLDDRRRIADRRLGIGCDQLIVLEPPQTAGADVFMRIYNPDGSEAGACGNATRCISGRLMGESGADRMIVETISGLLPARRREAGRIAVDMGPARLGWGDIPLDHECDTLHLPLSLGPLADPVGVNMGNPHAVFFVDDAEGVDLPTFGPVLEHYALFPERANIEVAQMLTPLDAGLGRIRMRVWERGTGITMACGTGACATLVAAARRGLSPRKAEIILDGGTLTIEWLPDDHVLMTGPVAVSFSGTLDPSLFP